MTPFSTLLQGLAPEGEAWAATVDADWMQGRTTYGGLSAALCVEAAGRLYPELPPLRAAQFAFIGPASGVLSATPSILRKGKSTVFIGVDLGGDAGLATRAVLCFGAERPSILSHSQAVAPDVPRPENCPWFFAEGGGPSFLQHFEIRLASGARPMTSSAEPEFVLWVRHRDPAAGDGLAALIALADAPPPAAMAMFSGPAPISTMTWALDVIGEPRPAEGWRLLRTTAEMLSGGYSSQAMAIWDSDGRPLVLARQTVAVFV